MQSIIASEILRANPLASENIWLP